MKMIYVGGLSKEPDRDSGWVQGFIDLGWDVTCLRTEIDLKGNWIIKKIKRRLNVGRENKMLQQNLLDLAYKEKAIWVHFRLPIEFDRATIMKLKEQNIIVTQYFNDDPFSKKSVFILHWKFRKALTAYDGHFVYRAHNIDSYRNAGAIHIEHCPPTYDPARHKLGERLANGSFLADAAFIGHWENDWRADCLDALKKAEFTVILKGGMWNRAIRGRSIGVLAPITHAFDKEYNHIYSNVVAGLCFFSKINNDTWTERPLEIIAVGGVIVCERTEEAETYFIDREEAFFFSSIDELIDIISDLKINPAKREQVREAGYKRLTRGAHTIGDRAKQVDRFVKSKIANIKY